MLMLVHLAVTAQKTEELTSKIEKVTVFINGAQVHRTAKTNIAAGKTELVFNGISPGIDKQSIQVKGDGKFTILSVTHVLNYLKQQEVNNEIKLLQDKRDELTAKITEQTSILNVYKQEQALLEKNQSIGGSQTGVNTDNLKAAADFQRSRMMEVLLKQNEINEQLRSLNASLQQVNAQLTLLDPQKLKPTSEIHVIISSKENTPAKFDISYYVKDAGWFANYDLRVKDVSSPMEIYYKANVYQSSGEDWKEIKVTLSNGSPDESGEAPRLEAWRLHYGEAEYDYGYDFNAYRINDYRASGNNRITGKVIDKVSKEALAGATIKIPGTTVGTITDLDGNFDLVMPAGASSLQAGCLGYQNQIITNISSYIVISLVSSVSLQEVAVTYSNKSAVASRDISGTGKKVASSSLELETSIIYKPTTFNYDIEEPYTILNDGKVYTIDIQALEIPASYQYFTVPKADKNAFLTAKITEWQELNLLPGEANLFFEGTYLGKTILDVANASDTLSVYLGRDKGIAIQRNKMKEFTKKQFVGNSKKETVAYEIILRNNKKQAVDIVAKDQFPISTGNEIEVEKLEYSNGEIEDNTDIITWKIKLEPGEQKTISLSYSVKYPKNRELHLE